MLHDKAESSQCKHDRRGLSLIEITAALVIMSFLAAVSVRHFAMSATNVIEASNAASAVQLQLDRLRQQAIQTGRPHGVRFQKSRQTGWSLKPFEIDQGRERTLAEATEMPAAVRLVPQRSKLVFDIDGSLSNGATIRVESPERSWQLEIVAVTGTVRIREL